MAKNKQEKKIRVVIERFPDISGSAYPTPTRCLNDILNKDTKIFS